MTNREGPEEDAQAHPAADGAPVSGAAGQGSVLRRANVTLAGSGLGAVLSIVNEVLCARYLGLATYGLYALSLILARVCEGIAIIGLPYATLHFVSIYRDRKESHRVLGTILASLLPPFAIGMALAGLFWFLAPWLSREVFGKPAAEGFIRAMALAIPFMGLSEILGVITRGFGQAAYYVLVRNLVPPVVFLCGLIALSTLRADPLWVAVAFGTAYLAAVAAGVASVLKVAGAAIFHLKPDYPFRALYTYSAPALVNNLLYLVIATTPILMLGALQNEREAGIFRACMQIVLPFDMIVIAFNAAVGHLYPVLDKNNRREELGDLVVTITNWMSALAFALFLVVVLNRHDLLSLMGPDFVGGADALFLLVVGHAALCAIGSAGYLLMMSGRQRYETANAAVAAGLSVVLNAVLVPAYGSVGAAIATTLACFAVSFLRVTQVRRQMDIRVVRLSLLRVAALAAATAAVVLAAMAVLPLEEGRGPVALVARVILILAVYGALHWHLGLDERGRAAVRAALRARFARARASS